jgi:two-component system NtrC family sensor kinase
MAYTSLTIIDANPSLFTVRVALEQRYEVAVNRAGNTTSGLELVRNSPPDFILLNPGSIGAGVNEFLTDLAKIGNDTPVIVAGSEEEKRQLRSVYSHIVGSVPPVYTENDLLPFLQRQRPTQTGRLRSKALAERAALVQANLLLERRVQEAMTLRQIGKAVASLTDLDTILTRIVEAAVFLLRAEESSIMLVDPDTNALYLRAQKGLGEKQATGFNLMVEDTLIGSVVRTGQPVRLARGTHEDERLKVVTGYLVNALLYVPLTLRDQVIGVLGVANQNTQKAFEKPDQRLLEALANYATLAIEVARQLEAINHLRQELAVAHTIASTVEELRERLPSDDPEIAGVLHRLESATHILVRMAHTEVPADV